MREAADPTRTSDHWLVRLRGAAAAVGRPIQVMEVCGTHTMAAFRSGLRTLLPANVTLLSGPGCPVCVTAQGDVDQMIELARDRQAVVCTYGDMLRVPGRRGSLEAARATGADVRIVFSSLDAVRIAEATPDREVVFAAVGFETTAPATAAAILVARQRGLANFSVLASHKQVLPALRALLEGGAVRLDGFLLPGHVSVILGGDAYEEIPARFGLPCVIAGFEDRLLAEATTRLVELIRDGERQVVNAYPEAVRDGGNCVARELLERVFETVPVRWRGLGMLPESGLQLREEFLEHDARERFALPAPHDWEPKGCRCGDVISGAATPAQCGLFGRACTPTKPVGPCMVSSEGTCQAWFKYHDGEALAGPTRRRKPAETPQA